MRYMKFYINMVVFIFTVDCMVKQIPEYFLNYKLFSGYENEKRPKLIMEVLWEQLKDVI